MANKSVVDQAWDMYFSPTYGSICQPANYSGVRKVDGVDYLVLENCNGILAVYDVSGNEPVQVNNNHYLSLLETETEI